MVGTIMPIGFKVNPWAVTCLNCIKEVAKSLDELPRCPQCDGTYCPTCVTSGEPSSFCAGNPGACPLGLEAPPPAAA